MHPNERHVREFYEALAGGDVRAAAAFIAEDAVAHVPGRSGIAGEYRGRQAILGVLGKLAELSGGSFSMTPSWILADDEGSIVLARAKASRGDAELDTEAVHVMRMRDGQAQEVRVFHRDQYHVDGFWG